MRESELVNQSIDFSMYIVEYYKWLEYKNKEFVMSKQILRSGTSIGANIHEAEYALGKREFINKMQSALRETVETEYWLTILERTAFLPEDYKELKPKCESLKKMLIKTLKKITKEKV